MKVIVFMVFTLLSALSSPLFAQTDTTKKDAKTQAILEELVGKIANDKNGKISHEEITGGIVLDQTKTRAGRDFYDLFIQNLVLPENVMDYTIVIDETPGLGTSTIIKVTINDIETYANYLQPKRDLIEETANEAVELASDFIINYTQILLELNNAEQSGSGIF
jgi:curli production assembly/transport component CsgE